jgi:hypothetical protein
MIRRKIVAISMGSSFGGMASSVTPGLSGHPAFILIGNTAGIMLSKWKINIIPVRIIVAVTKRVLVQSVTLRLIQGKRTISSTRLVDILIVHGKIGVWRAVVHTRAE